MCVSPSTGFVCMSLRGFPAEFSPLTRFQPYCFTTSFNTESNENCEGLYTESRVRWKPCLHRSTRRRWCLTLANVRCGSCCHKLASCSLRVRTGRKEPDCRQQSGSDTPRNTRRTLWRRLGGMAPLSYPHPQCRDTMKCSDWRWACHRLSLRVLAR